MARIGVIGLGYVGLVSAACLAELGHDVVGIDVSEDRLSALRRGEVPILETGLSHLIAKHTRSGRLRFAGQYAPAIPESEFVFVAVNTPSRDDGSADIQYVLAALRSLLMYARPGLVIVMKSTVPVGTGDEFAKLAAEVATGVEIVSNPEFLREGSAVADFLRPDRVVIGGEASETIERVARLFDGIDAPIIRCSRRAAELAKYASNALLATRISFINEIAAVSAAVGVDVRDVAEIIGADHRIGPAFLRAGLGWGGSCFPKDVRALIATAAEHGYGAPILRAVLDVNSRQRQVAFEQLRAAVAGCDRPTVAVLGLAFKPGTDDIREAPAIDVIGRLIEEGIHVRAHDPAAMANARRVLPVISYCETAYEAVEGADAVLLATEWPEYTALDWRAVRARMRGDVLIDGRQALDGDAMAQLGFTYVSVGDPAPRDVRSHAGRR